MALGAQDPLRGATAQLVAGSPTKWHGGHTFPIYRLFEDDAGALEVRRRIFEYTPNQGELGAGIFQPSRVERNNPNWTVVFSGLPIDG